MGMRKEINTPSSPKITILHGGDRAGTRLVGVYCSLQGAEGSSAGARMPTVEVFREIAKSIATGLQALRQDVPLPDGTALPRGEKLGIARACRAGINEESPFADRREYVEVALAYLEPHGCGLLLMLDEFDKLQEGIDSGITSPQVPENIRFLVQTYPRFSTVLTGSRRLKRLREGYWSALFGLGTRFSVTALPEEAARRLVAQPGGLVIAGAMRCQAFAGSARAGPSDQGQELPRPVGRAALAGPGVRDLTPCNRERPVR
jgi:type I restriction enzyme M protein